MRLAAFFLSALAGSAFADPPARVGRLSVVEGEIVFAQEAAESAAAVINTPVTTGDSLRTRQARAEVQIGSITLHLGDHSRLHFMQVDDQVVRAYLVQGVVIARIRDDADEFELSAPGMAATFPRTGRYRLEVEPGAAALTVRDGEAQVTQSSGERFTVMRNETARIGYERHTIHAAASRDRLDEWATARLEQEDRSVASRYLSREHTGYQDLDDYGTWEETPEYGPVWKPHLVYNGWAPYRYGHWSFVHPWGWTWIDHSPWGFAPFHYGRWAYRHKVWCWVPGQFVKRPHFAPALVAFGHGHKHHDVPKVWHPLAPHQPWKPSHPEWRSKEPAALIASPVIRNVPEPAAPNASRAATVTLAPSALAPAAKGNALAPHESASRPARPIAAPESASTTASNLRDRGKVAVRGLVGPSLRSVPSAQPSSQSSSRMPVAPPGAQASPMSRGAGSSLR